MPIASEPAPKGRRAKNASRKAAMKKQNRETRLIGDLRKSSFFTLLDLPRVRPEDALNEALTRAVAVARFASKRVEALPEAEYWIERDLDPDLGSVKLIPHAWIETEAAAWDRVAWLAARMTQLGIEDRSVAAREQASEAFASALEAVTQQLNLTKAQRAEIPSAIRAALPAQTGER